MGKGMLVKYYKYFGEKYGEKRSEREKRGEKDKGDQLLNIVIFFCVAVDPRYKLSNYIKMATMVMFGPKIGEKLWATVNSSFRELFEEYKNIYAPSEKALAPNDSQELVSKGRDLMRSIIDQQMNENGGGSVTAKSEIEKYFSEENEEDKQGFDILKYWKDNENRFPVLSHMARDLLAIPISTVASESAFSLGGRILDDFRSSLTSIMVEKLICASDWIRSEYVSVEEDTEQLVKLEEGKSICYFIPIHYFLFYLLYF
jgi:hypothetical protein